MKKRNLSLLLALVLLLGLLAAPASAVAAGTVSGLRVVSTNDPYKVELLDAAGQPAKDAVLLADQTTVVYRDAVKFKLTCPTTSSSYKLTVALTGGDVPTVDNIAYIDQKAGSDTEFVIYPMTPTGNTTYSVRISETGAALQEVAQVAYCSGTPAGYKLGDVDGDGWVNIQDAIRILQELVEQEPRMNEAEKKRGDLNGDSKLDISDAVKLLQMLVA